jgi:hypothetical protein
METRFPEAIGRVIVREWPQRQSGAGRFDALVRQFGLQRCALGESIASNTR